MKLEELLERAKEIEFVAEKLPGVIEDILNEIGHDEFRMTMRLGNLVLAFEKIRGHSSAMARAYAGPPVTNTIEAVIKLREFLSRFAEELSDENLTARLIAKGLKETGVSE